MVQGTSLALYCPPTGVRCLAQRARGSLARGRECAHARMLDHGRAEASSESSPSCLLKAYDSRAGAARSTSAAIGRAHWCTLAHRIHSMAMYAARAAARLRISEHAREAFMLPPREASEVTETFGCGTCPRARLRPALTHPRELGHGSQDRPSVTRHWFTASRAVERTRPIMRHLVGRADEPCSRQASS